MRATVRVLAAAAVLATIGATALAAAATPSPQQIYQRLLTTPISDSALPSGFSGAKTDVLHLSSTFKKHHHHAVGGVAIDLNYGNAEILYFVFPTRADAVADWRDANLKKQAKTTVSAPADFPWPALIANMSVKTWSNVGTTATNGETEAAMTSKNVIVQAFTLSTHNTDSGDVVGSIRLARYALKHLQALRK